MHVIAIIGEKGGTGKSMVTASLAVGLAQADKAVVVIDLDPQTSISNWHDRRLASDATRDNPVVVPTMASRLEKTLQSAEEGGADYVLIDVAGRSESAAVDAARAAQLVIAPVSDDFVELETLPTVKKMVTLAGSPAHLVLLNKMHPSVTRQADDMRAFILTRFEMRCLPLHLSQRDAYSDAFAEGLSPIEFEPAGKAAQEAAALCAFVSRFMTTETQDGIEDSRPRQAV